MALRSGVGFARLAVGKFGLQALVKSMARELDPRGIHVAHGVIDSAIGTPAAHQRQPNRVEDTFLASEAIAEQYWLFHQRPRTIWTQELDFRPYGKTF